MVNHKFSYKELNDRLIKQTNLLADLCLQFDKGNYDYADVISTKIGSIINFKNRDSILPNMKKQESMVFCSTAKVLDSTENILLYRTLVATVRTNNEIRYIPKLNNGTYPNTWNSFKVWSESPIFILNAEPNQTNFDGLMYIYKINDETQFILSREDVIKLYRDKFGGAHHDDRMEERRYFIAAGISSIEHIDHPDTKYIPGEKYKSGEPFKYLFEMAIRQIAHELILSIKKSFNFQIEYQPQYKDYTNKRPNNLQDVLITVVEKNEGQKEITTKFL